LHWAAVGGRIECVEALLAATANKAISNHNGRTPRDLAAAKGQASVEHLLGEAFWSDDVRKLHSSLEARVQEALDELRLGRDDEPTTDAMQEAANAIAATSSAAFDVYDMENVAEHMPELGKTEETGII